MNYRKMKKKNRLLGNSTMPPLLSAALFIILIVFIITAKGLMYNSYKEAAAPVLAEDFSLTEENKLNKSEEIVLTMLKEVIQPAGRVGRMENSNSVYYNTLEKYLTGNGVELSNRQADTISGYITDIQEILYSEGIPDYTELSLDGRRVVFYLLGRIYKTCGLQLIGNGEGDIRTISLHSGKILYHNTEEGQSEFQINTLAAVMLFLFVLFVSCVLFARKHQLFNKEENYDGYDKERFA